MSESPNKLIKFWQELKRRKTGKVIVAYAATAFILLQLADILTPALLLPEWTTRLITLILIIGFPIAVIFSWVFDITPEGIKKTESIEESEKTATVKKPVKRIFSISNIIIAALIIAVGILAYPKIFKQDTLEKLRTSRERISVAVLPFQNLTNDTTLNYWQEGIQNDLITYLSNNPEELEVRQSESITNLIQGKGLTNYASITPSVASGISQKLDADVFIIGTIKRAGTVIRVNAQLMDSKTKEIFKSFEIDEPYKEEVIFNITDSLRKKITDFLIVTKLTKEASLNPDFQHPVILTNSPEAFKYATKGNYALWKQDWTSAIKWYSQAIAKDSNYFPAKFMISMAYMSLRNYQDAKKWCLEVYEKRDQFPIQMEIGINLFYAICFETPYEEIKYIRQGLDIDDQAPLSYYSLGWAYYKLLQYDKAIPEIEKALEIYDKWDSKPPLFGYTVLGDAYHETGQYKKERKLYKKAEKDFPNDFELTYNQSLLSLTERDTTTANRYIEKFKSICKEQSYSEADIAKYLGWIYWHAGILDKAEEYLHQALSLEPENPDRLYDLASFLIDKDRNINEGLQLVNTALKLRPDNYNYLHTKGWGLYKQGKYQEALDTLQKSWNIRMKNTIYGWATDEYLHLEAARKAVANLK
jgi:tetratricopeptide (TPR) repeat protein